MKDKLLSIRKLNLDSVSAQAALMESRNYFFDKKITENKDHIVESSLYKDFDSNIIALGIESMMNRYSELSIKESLGMSFQEYMDMPIYYKKVLEAKIKVDLKSVEEKVANARKQA